MVTLLYLSNLLGEGLIEFGLLLVSDDSGVRPCLLLRFEFLLADF